MTTDEFRSFMRGTPLVGGLVDCDASDHWKALGQTFIVLLFSTAPIWLGALIVYGSGDDLSYGALRIAMRRSIANGELYMYCTAILAPIFWVALVDLPGARVFPSKMSHMVLIGIIDSVAAVFFGLISAGKPLNHIFTFETSTYMFLFSTVLLYLGTVYHESRVADATAATAEFKRQESDFTSAVREHRQ